MDNEKSIKMNIFHNQLLRHGFVENQRAIDPTRSQSYSMADEGRITVTVDIRNNLASFWIQRPASRRGKRIQVAYQGQAREVGEIPALLGKILVQLRKREDFACKDIG